MRVAINGYGRIGRCLLRAATMRDDCRAIDFVAINELADPETIAYLTRYDSTHGRFPGDVELKQNTLRLTPAACKAPSSDAPQFVDVEIIKQRNTGKLPWRQFNVDLVFDCSGAIVSTADASLHIQAGSKRVLLSQPGAPDIKALVYGVNHNELSADQKILSAASCTSNALIPCLAVLEKRFGIENGVITTIHASMHDQPVIDAYHSGDLRKNRAASQSIIPVDTQLAIGVGRVLPTLKERFIAHALRVPVSNVSAINVTVNLKSSTTAEHVNEVLMAAASAELQGILGCETAPLASCDYNGDPRSGVVDARQTEVSGERTVNLLIWFDNEWAFANRMLDIALYMRGI